MKLKIVAAVDIGGTAVDPEGLPLQDLLAHLEKGGRVEDMIGSGKKGFTGVEALTSGIADLLVETTPTNIRDGEPAMTHIPTALGQGQHRCYGGQGSLSPPV